MSDPFRCICDPDDLFEPPDPMPRAVEGCPAHRARWIAQQWFLRLNSSERRICGDETEPDGDLCTGWLIYEPGDVQAKCTVCGGWEGRWAPRKMTAKDVA